MRQLTDSELKTRDKGWLEYLGNAGIYAVDEFEVFEHGFIAALDHSAAQIAALTAEIDGLKLQIKARDILLSKIGIDPARIKVDDNE